MADEDSQVESQTVRPRGGPNTLELSKTKKKYKTFDQKARTEYDRLVKENNKQQLKPNTDAVQHATFYWLCVLREGSMHSYKFIFLPLIEVWFHVSISHLVSLFHILTPNPVEIPAVCSHLEFQLFQNRNFTLNPVIYKCINFIEQIFFLNKPPQPRKRKTHKVQFSYGHLLVVHANFILTLIEVLFPILGL